MQARLALLGFKPVSVIGGATAAVGDPSGKREDRPLLGPDVLHTNIVALHADVQQAWQAIQACVERADGAVDVLADATAGSFEAGMRGPGAPDSPGATLDPEWAWPNTCASLPDLQLLNNADWLGELKLTDFMRTVGRHMRMSAMLAKDSVASRLASPAGLSFTEFTYQALQAADFAHLHRHHGVTLQLGGSDQWGNITAGMDLISRTVPGAAVAGGMTVPLLTTADGQKFGKSEGNAIYLSSAAGLSHFAFYQALYRASDADCVALLPQLTLLPQAKLAQVHAAAAQEPDAGHYQRALATAVTDLVRGPDAVQQAEAASAVAFCKPGTLPDAQALHLAAQGDQVPTLSVDAAALLAMPIVDALLSAGIVSSKAEARRALKAGSVSVHGERVQEPSFTLGESDFFTAHGVALLRLGKRHRVILHCT